MSHIREGLAVLRSFPQTGTSLVLEGDAVSFLKLTLLFLFASASSGRRLRWEPARTI
jgi:hypothetical protein